MFILVMVTRLQEYIFFRHCLLAVLTVCPFSEYESDARELFFCKLKVNIFMLLWLLPTQTTVAGVGFSARFVCVCVCLFICVISQKPVQLFIDGLDSAGFAQLARVSQHIQTQTTLRATSVAVGRIYALHAGVAD